MTVDLKRISVESGYLHDDTGHWIDCSYTRYEVEISGASALEKLERGLGEVLKMLKSQLEAEKLLVDELTRISNEKNEKATAEYVEQLEKYNSNHWFKRLLLPKPTQPLIHEVSTDAVDDFTRRVEEVEKKIQSVQALDPEFGVYRACRNRIIPIEYDIMMIRSDQLNAEKLTHQMLKSLIESNR